MPPTLSLPRYHYIGCSLTADAATLAAVVLAPADRFGAADGVLDVATIELIPASGTFEKTIAALSEVVAARWHLSRNWQVVADVGNYARGRSFSDALRASGFERRWGVAPKRIELDARDLPKPVAEGWRIKVPRRAIVGALADAIARDRLHVPRLMSHAGELRVQLGNFRNRRPGEAEVPEELAVALGLAVWKSANAGSPGGFLPITRRA